MIITTIGCGAPAPLWLEVMVFILMCLAIVACGMVVYITWKDSSQNDRK